MKINTIVFDMGGVLLDFGAELFSRRLHVGAEGEALLRQHLLCTTDWVRLDRGTITEEEVYAHACARLPAELHAAAEYIIYHWNEPIVPITGTADVVHELKARGYTLYLLSNAARRQHTYWHDIPGSECFSGTLISADVHLLKPEAAIYQALFDKFDLTAASCLIPRVRLERRSFPCPFSSSLPPVRTISGAEQSSSPITASGMTARVSRKRGS